MIKDVLNEFAGVLFLIGITLVGYVLYSGFSALISDWRFGKSKKNS